MITDSEDRSMIAELEQIIQAEEAKPEAERDVDLIDDCIREIAELKGVKADLSDEEVAEITDKLIKRTEREQKKKRLIRFVAGIAAVFVLVTGITACTINPALINWFVKIVRMPFGTSIEKDKITFFCYGVPTEYDSIEQLIQSNDLHIYYPTHIPNGVSLDNIEMVDEGSISVIYFDYSNNHFYYSVQLNHNANISKKYDIITTMESNGLEFDICFFDELYMAVSCFDENTYIIQTDSLDDMIFVIGGLKKESK